MLQTVVSVDPLTESNCYILVENDRCLVIDPGEHVKLLSILKDCGWEPELILLTHEHCDHMAGLDALRDQYPQACFAATAVCNAGIQSLRLNLSRSWKYICIFVENPGSIMNRLSAGLQMRSLPGMRSWNGAATCFVWCLCPATHRGAGESFWMKTCFSAEII